MVDVIGRAKVIITGDVDSTSIDQAGGKIGDNLKKAALVGGAALGTLAVAGFKAFQAFEEAEAQSRKLSNVLGNMGQSGAVEGVEKLADSLMRLTGIDDEVIKGGQTILATFSAVAESAGDVGGTFERATQASLDMSAVFGSVESAARVLGKALSDPEKAAALLRRSNVILTEEQKNLIAGFVAAGDAAGAQGVILDALEDRYAGTAEAAQVGSETMKVAFAEVQESLGGLIADLFEGEGEKSFIDLATDATFDLAEAIEDFQGSKSWKNLKSDMQDFGGDLQTVGKAIKTITTNLDNLLTTVSQDEKKGLLYWLGQVDRRINPIRQVANAINSVSDAINALPGLPDWLAGGGGVTGGGGRSFASGGRVSSSGLALVGETGPELVSLPAGSYVHNNNDTKEMLAAASGGDTFNITHVGSMEGLVRELDWRSRYRRVGA